MASRKQAGSSKRPLTKLKAPKGSQGGSSQPSVKDWRLIAAAAINSGKDDAVRIDLPAGKVKYDGARIKMHRDVRDITGDEEVVRAFLIHRLVNQLG